MRYIKKILAIAALVSTVGACYVETRSPRYVARRECAYGWYWNGYHCHRRW
jgi:hypothetical protein